MFSTSCRLKAGQPIEDTGVELKATWIKPEQAARRLAGQANAAHGEPVLWIIGVDEKGVACGVATTDLASWHAQVSTQFDELAPPLIMDLAVPVDGTTVVALLFETDRAPFVVANPQFGSGPGPVEREVPWRAATGVRSAKRADLLAMLSPLQRLPDIEWLGVKLDGWKREAKSGDHEAGVNWILEARLYVVPRVMERVVIPFHKCQAWFEIPGVLARTHLEKLKLGPRDNRVPMSLLPRFGPGRPASITVEGTDSEVVVEGPGLVIMSGRCSTSPSLLGETREATIDFVLGCAGTESRIEKRLRLLHGEPLDQRFDRFEWEG